jgi:hypothetical protein
MSVLEGGVDLDRVAAVLLVVVVFIVTPAVMGQQVTASERVVEVLDNGILKITDVVNVSSPRAEVGVGFTEDMRPKLVGYYVEGGEASIEVTPTEANIFFIVARPVGEWGGGSVKLVTVWRDTLLKVGNQYELIMAANPLMREASGSLALTVKVPAGAEIKSVQGVGLQITDKTTASGSVEMEGGLQFKSMRVVVDAPGLVFLEYERVELKVEDPRNPTAELTVKVRNNGEDPVSDIPVQLTSSATVESVTSGFERLGTSRQGEIITVRLNRQLGKGESIQFTIRYRDQNLLSAADGRLKVQPPKIYDTQVGEYMVTVIIPPATSIIFDNMEPWKVQPVASMSTSAAFRLEKFYPTPGFQISLTYQPASFINPVPLLLVALIISGAAAVIIPRVRGAGTVKSIIQPEVRESLSRLGSLWLEAAVDVNKTVEMLDPASGRGMGGKSLDNSIRLVRRVKDAISEIQHKHTSIHQSIVPKIEAYNRGLGELLDALQALSRSAEDYRGKKLTRRVYERVYREYVRLVRDLVGELNGLTDDLRHLN